MLKPTIRERETLPEDKKVYRTRVVLAFMATGIPLTKLDCPALRELLAKNNFCLCLSRHMMDLVPFILQEKCRRTKSKVRGKYISIIFDGTTRLGEVLVYRKLECRRVSSTDSQFAIGYTGCRL